MDVNELKATLREMKGKLCDLNKPCYWNPLSNPYKVNPRTGLDHFSTLAWQLTMWKMENVFPYDLRLRVPVVALLTIFSMKGELTSKQRFNEATVRRSDLLPQRIAARA